MKKILILFSAILLFIANSSGQTSTTVYTCKGGPVNALLYADISQQEKDQVRQQFINDYGTTYNFTANDILEDPTPTFNCHSYAWHLREGNTNRVWISNASQQVGACYDQLHNIDKYWTDGCFIQVCNEADADKTHYYCGDHSAVTSTVVQGKFESKWGGLPALRHFPTSVPYSQPTTVNYYASTKMTGDASGLCTGTRTFSVKNISGATYIWTYSNTLSVVGATNTNQLTVQINGSSTGTAWVQVQISTPCNASSVTSRIDFSVGTPAITGSYMNPNFSSGSLQSGQSVCAGTIRVTINEVQATTYTWQRIYGSAPFIDNGGYIDITLAQDESVSFLVTATSSCGSTERTVNFIADDPQCGSGGGFFKFTVSPNPVKGNMNVIFDKPVKANESITMRLYTFNSFTMVKQWKLEGGQKQYSLDKTDVKSGQYVLEATIGNAKVARQVIIE